MSNNSERTIPDWSQDQIRKGFKVNEWRMEEPVKKQLGRLDDQLLIGFFQKEAINPTRFTKDGKDLTNTAFTIAVYQRALQKLNFLTVDDLDGIYKDSR